jgi:HD-GYP domain-containing protein (c-di-GMP phosphodiesterase class II)
MLRLLQPRRFLANHIAYQHHERQDGSGYPLGLAGTNRIARDVRAAEDRRMLLIAEIAAVADVYDALISDRPYRPAHSRDEAIAILRRMAGPHLNREVVRRFLTAVPGFSLGIDVTITSGRLAGYRGVVIRLSTRTPDRPVVRLTQDPAGRRIHPVEVDLAREPSLAATATLRPSASTAVA